MRVRVPPAHPRVEYRRAELERLAYLRLIQGRITVEQYRNVIAPPAAKRRRWWRAGR